MMCIVEPRRTGDAFDRIMIVEERMIGRGKDDVHLIIGKMSGREEIGPLIVCVEHGALLIGTRHGEGIGLASAYRHDDES